MKLLMVSGDRSILQGKRSAFWHTLEELSRHWERIDVITPRTKELRIMNNELRNSFPNVFFHPSRRGLWYQPWWILIKGDELIKEHHHDVMTVHEYPPFYNGIGAKWLHRAGKIPYCLEIHHIVGHPVAASWKEKIGRILSKLYLKRDAYQAAAVRTVNESVKRTLTEWGMPGEKIHVAPSFYLNAETLKPDPSIPKKFDVAFCARIVPNKGWDTVIRAIASLPDVSIIVVGDGPERTPMEQLAFELGMINRSTFKGWLNSNADVYRAMQSAKMFVMHSTSEGGPRIALEAMAIGMPVIATRVGVMPDVIQEGVNGVFTDGTANGLAAKITMLLKDARMRENLGKEASKIVGKFERGKLVKEYAEFLKSSAQTAASELT
ncbi:MAG: glycosyltransferase [Candidatus Peribacteraceae bacterium]|nr:glycosyltransferase [Candidatus Peribacteraceae bacterium]